MKRGDVCWYEFPPPDKRRPVLILTRDSAISFLNAVTVAAITTTVRGVKSEVVLGSEDGMPEYCAANFYQVQTVPKRRIGDRVTTLSLEKMNEVDRALCFALGISDEAASRRLAESSAVYMTVSIDEGEHEGQYIHSITNAVVERDE